MQGDSPTADVFLHWIEKAEAARRDGRDKESVRFLARAVGIDPQKAASHCLQHADSGLRQNYVLALAAACGIPRPRAFHLLREDALLGRFQPALTATQRETLRAVFDHVVLANCGRSAFPLAAETIVQVT